MKTIMQLLLFLASLFSMQPLCGQEPVPKWAKEKIPNGYYYGVGIASTEMEALKMAKDDALIKSLPIDILESYHERSLNIDSIKYIVQTDISQRDYIAQSLAINVPEGKKVYALLYCANKKDMSYDYYDDPDFERELNIWNYGKYPASVHALVPGWAQFNKGSKTKGILFITGEAALLIAAATAECFRSSYTSKVHSTHDKQNYANKANHSKQLRNALLGAAAGVYLWNVIDGLAAKGKRGCASSKDMSLTVLPYVSTDHHGGGLILALTF